MLPVGESTCTIVSSSATQISVTVPADATPSTAASLVVDIVGKGYAKFDSINSTVTIAPAISSISPTSGSTAGVLLTLTGAGFQKGAAVTVGGKPCAIRSLTSTTITCKATSTGEVALSFNDFTSIKCASSCALTSSSSSTPTVTSVSPLTPASATSFTLTIQGTKLNLGTDTVTLVSQFDSSILFAGSVASPTASQVSASFSNVAAGLYTVEVTSSSNIASGAYTVNVPLTASVASSIDSSIVGGVTLSLTGSGFISDAQKEKNIVTVCGLPCGGHTKYRHLYSMPSSSLY